MIALADIERAAERIAGVIRGTPTEPSPTLSAMAGRTFLLKPEHRQRTGSFKIRGAYNLISTLPDGVPVVAASAGNHAQGVALAAALTARRALIHMPADASLPKVEATRGYGAEVVLAGDCVDDAIALARTHAERTGAVFVPPFDDERILAGQGTVGLELAVEASEAQTVVVPAGGGGLVSGIATALAHRRPGTRVVAVQAAEAASLPASLAARRPVPAETLTTMADGIAVRQPSELTLAHVAAYVDEVVTVTDEEISRALLLLLERSKWVVEPAGAVAVAAVLAGRVPGTGPVAAVVSGGNVDPLLLIKLIDHGLSAAGRFLLLRIVLPDRPGALARLTAAVAEMRLNVLSVEHHREGRGLGIDDVEVLLTLETRDPTHRDEVVGDLRRCGYSVTLLR